MEPITDLSYYIPDKNVPFFSLSVWEMVFLFKRIFAQYTGYAISVKLDDKRALIKTPYANVITDGTHRKSIAFYPLLGGIIHSISPTDARMYGNRYKQGIIMSELKVTFLSSDIKTEPVVIDEKWDYLKNIKTILKNPIISSIASYVFSNGAIGYLKEVTALITTSELSVEGNGLSVKIKNKKILGTNRKDGLVEALSSSFYSKKGYDDKSKDLRSILPLSKHKSFFTNCELLKQLKIHEYGFKSNGYNYLYVNWAKKFNAPEPLVGLSEAIKQRLNSNKPCFNPLEFAIWTEGYTRIEYIGGLNAKVFALETDISNGSVIVTISDPATGKVSQNNFKISTDTDKVMLLIAQDVIKVSADNNELFSTKNYPVGQQIFWPNKYILRYGLFFQSPSFENIIVTRYALNIDVISTPVALIDNSSVSITKVTFGNIIKKENK